LDTKKLSDDIRYSLRPNRLTSSTKKKSTEINPHSVNFESFLEHFTLHLKYRCYKNFYLHGVIFQKTNHEKHPQRTVLVKTSCNLHKIF